MVRLKDIDYNSYILSDIYFNSTMVRLKGKEGRKGKEGNNKFQFHYGSIKGSPGSIGDAGIRYDISIPLWFD
jgi:hypothetical protein